MFIGLASDEKVQMKVDDCVQAYQISFDGKKFKPLAHAFEVFLGLKKKMTKVLVVYIFISDVFVGFIQANGGSCSASAKYTATYTTNVVHTMTLEIVLRLKVTGQC